VRNIKASGPLRGIRPAPITPKSAALAPARCRPHGGDSPDRVLRDVSHRRGKRVLFFRTRRRIYFGVGKIDRDQVASYAQRKGFTVNERNVGWRRS